LRFSSRENCGINSINSTSGGRITYDGNVTGAPSVGAFGSTIGPGAAPKCLAGWWNDVGCTVTTFAGRASSLTSNSGTGGIVSGVSVLA